MTNKRQRGKDLVSFSILLGSKSGVQKQKPVVVVQLSTLTKDREVIAMSFSSAIQENLDSKVNK